jgi:glycosyltransferase involved in cell wall biosynthesis
MQLIDEYDLGKRVIMPGYRSDLKEIFSAMDIFIYPSLEKDTSPLALLSAISSGLPVAVTNIKSLKEITDLCPALDVFDSDDRRNLFSLMEKYVDKSIRDVNGRKNREAGKMYFDIATHSDKMMKILNLNLSG